MCGKSKLNSLALYEVNTVGEHCWGDGELVKQTLDSPFISFYVFSTQKHNSRA